jgi:hypothetical protein
MVMIPRTANECSAVTKDATRGAAAMNDRIAYACFEFTLTDLPLMPVTMNIVAITTSKEAAEVWKSQSELGRLRSYISAPLFAV